jgi:hypothetical protein
MAIEPERIACLYSPYDETKRFFPIIMFLNHFRSDMNKALSTKIQVASGQVMDIRPGLYTCKILKLNEFKPAVKSGV